MFTKQFMLVLAFIAALTLIRMLHNVMDIPSHNPVNFENQKLTLESQKHILMKFIRQRNNISRLLNIKQQTIGQMECEVNVFIYMY